MPEVHTGGGSAPFGLFRFYARAPHATTAERTRYADLLSLRACLLDLKPASEAERELVEIAQTLCRGWAADIESAAMQRPPPPRGKGRAPKSPPRGAVSPAPKRQTKWKWPPEQTRRHIEAFIRRKDELERALGKHMTDKAAIEQMAKEFGRSERLSQHRIREIVKAMQKDASRWRKEHGFPLRRQSQTPR